MAEDLLTFKRELEERTSEFAVSVFPLSNESGFSDLAKECDELVRIFQTVRNKMFQKRKAMAS